MALFDAVDIIRVKRDGGVLTPDQIDWTIDAYTKGVIKDEQMAALAMAIFLRGMDRGEIARWTDAMIRSGARMDFSLQCPEHPYLLPDRPQQHPAGT